MKNEIYYRISLLEEKNTSLKEKYQTANPRIDDK